MTVRASAFDLPDRLAAKTAPTLIGDDERHFAAIARSMDRTIADLTERLDATRRAPRGVGGESVERDMEIRRLSSRLAAMRRFGLDLCLGRIVTVDDPEPIYIGRLGLTDADGTRLLVDWRSPAAEPFFAATLAHTMGLSSRRRYRWTRGRITDYWDEVFTADAVGDAVALDDESAFIASLGASRSPRMRDVLSTIQADQDAIIRAGSPGALVVDGGPGTGKTVVALHRSAYLLYADPLVGRRRGGVLFVGPSSGYLAYVSDVLPGLGEDGVHLCTLRDLVSEGASAPSEPDAARAARMASIDAERLIESTVRYHENPPTAVATVETPWAEVRLGAADWAEAFDAAEPGTPHNEARDQVWEQLLAILLDQHDDDEIPVEQARQWIAQNTELRAVLTRAWPLLDPVGVVADLLSVPSYLRAVAPWLDAQDAAALRRDDGRAWTSPDLPLLDAARQRIGDPDAAQRRVRERAVLSAQRESMSLVIDQLIGAEHDMESVMHMLRQDSMREALVDVAEVPRVDPDLLAGPFAHIVVDEAQELTDAEWQMLLRRCPSRSFTVVGDRAQARHGFTETWEQRLTRVGLGTVSVASLTINYRTPEEVMAEAEPVIRAALPDANVPTSIRSSGIPVRFGNRADLQPIVDAWLGAHQDGVAAVIGDGSFPQTARVRSLTPESAKGLEFDLVVLVEPETFGSGIEGAVDRYVAMTRATEQLVLLSA